MVIIESATLVTSVLLVVVVWRLSLDLQGIRDGVLADIYRALVQQQFAEGRFAFWDEARRGHEGEEHESAGAPRHGCFVVWVWRDGEWKTRALPQGVQSALPPPYPGAFSGDLAKTWVSLQRR
jgi:hypothetical protein